MSLPRYLMSPSALLLWSPRHIAWMLAEEGLKPLERVLGEQPSGAKTLGGYQPWCSPLLKGTIQ